MEYFIRVNYEEIEVTEEVYKAYCQGIRKERYFRESDIHNGIFSYNALDTGEMNGCDLFPDQRAEVEKQVELRLETEELLKALRRLSDKELALIRRIYFYDQSLRRVSQDEGIPLSTLHYRIKTILKKLRKLMDKNK